MVQKLTMSSHSTTAAAIMKMQKMNLKIMAIWEEERLSKQAVVRTQGLTLALKMPVLLPLVRTALAASTMNLPDSSTRITYHQLSS